MSAMEELRDDPASRKRFLKMMGSAGGASALAIFMAACGSSDKKTTSTASGGSTATSTSAVKGDLAILNYALTLEYLEAAFYKQAGESGMIKDKKTLALAMRFGETEQEHVDAITATIKKLGGKPVAAPKTAFASVIKAGPAKILSTAATVENLGAAAYLAQAPKIASKEVLAAALSIHTVEARHAAALNKLIGKGFTGASALEGSIPDGAFAKPMEMSEVLKAAQPFIAA